MPAIAITHHAETVARLYADGWDDFRIGQYLGVKKSAVTYVRRLLHFKRERIGEDEMSEAEMQEVDQRAMIYNLTCNDWDVHEIAKAVGLDAKQVKKIARSLPSWWRSESKRAGVMRS